MKLGHSVRSSSSTLGAHSAGLSSVGALLAWRLVAAEALQLLQALSKPGLTCPKAQWQTCYQGPKVDIKARNAPLTRQVVRFGSSSE